MKRHLVILELSLQNPVLFLLPAKENLESVRVDYPDVRWNSIAKPHFDQIADDQLLGVNVQLLSLTNRKGKLKSKNTHPGKSHAKWRGVLLHAKPIKSPELTKLIDEKSFLFVW